MIHEEHDVITMTRDFNQTLKRVLKYPWTEEQKELVHEAVRRAAGWGEMLGREKEKAEAQATVSPTANAA